MTSLATRVYGFEVKAGDIFCQCRLVSRSGCSCRFAGSWAQSNVSEGFEVELDAHWQGICGGCTAERCHEMVIQLSSRCITINYAIDSMKLYMKRENNHRITPESL